MPAVHHPTLLKVTLAVLPAVGKRLGWTRPPLHALATHEPSFPELKAGPAGPAGPAKPAPENDWKLCENPGKPFPLLVGKHDCPKAPSDLRSTIVHQCQINDIKFRPDNFRRQKIPPTKHRCTSWRSVSKFRDSSKLGRS